MGWAEAQKKVNGELVKLKTFETQGFKYSDNIAKANTEAEKLLNLEKQIALYQKQFSIKSQNISGKYGDLIDVSQLNNLQNQVKALSVTTPDVKNKMKNFNVELQEIRSNAVNSSKALRLAQQDARSFGSELAKSATKFATW